MDLEVGLLIASQDCAEVFEGSTIAVYPRVLDWLQEISQMKVLLHIEGYVDGCYCKEESRFILLHNLYQGSVSLHES
jgi:hypothetical protein